jgi:hypothetical protein
VQLAAKIDKDLYSSELKERYIYFVNALRKIAALNVVTNIAEDIFSTISTKELTYRLSNNFADVYTTILTDKEISHLATQGTFKTLIREQSIITMCSLFEDYINSLIEITKLDSKEATSYNHIKQDFGLEGGDTVSLRKIYFMIKKLGFTSHPFKHQQSIQLLGEIITIRNVLAHFDGRIVKTNHDTAIYEIHKDNGEIILPDNSIDDFIHRILIYMSGFTKRIDDYLEENKIV